MRLFFSTIMILMLAGCYYQSNSVYSQLVMVDSLLRNEQVDSALKRLHLVNLKDCDDESFFYYCLLLPQTLYKNYQVIESDSMIRCAVDYYRKQDNRRKLAQALLYNGDILYDEGKSADAMALLKEAEAIVEGMDDNYLRHNIYFQIASINSYYDERQLALDYIKKALLCSLKSGRLDHIAYDYLNYSVYHHNIGNNDSSRFYIDKCISLIDHLPKKPAIRRGNVWKSMGFAYFSVDKERSKDFFEKSIALAPTGDALGALARLMLEMKDTVRAKLLLSESIKDNEFPHIRADNILLFSDIENQQGNHKRAAELSQEAYALKDSLTRLQQAQNVKAVQVEYDWIKKSKQAASVRRWLWAGLAITILIGVVAVAVVLYRWDKTRRRLAEEQRQVEQLQAEEQQVNKELNKTKKTVERLKRARQEQDKTMSSRQREWELHGKTMERGHRLFMELNNGGSIVKWSSDDFKDFRTYYNSVNRAFAETIAQNYEPLSPNLYMLAALGHAGKNDDDIMATMGLTLKALRTTRTRLSQKRKNA